MYATKTRFPAENGQRASLCRDVIIRDGGSIEPAKITSIGKDDGITFTSAYHGTDHDDLKFVETKTEADVEALPDGSWTWPPRV